MNIGRRCIRPRICKPAIDEAVSALAYCLAALRAGFAVGFGLESFAGDVLRQRCS